jgi:cell fate (sporulation/competence/biofilm development) regulator YlbF (YheA/YmcA/DUF963 family)
MNVYDEANNLAKVLKESSEYKDFLLAKETLEKDPEKFKMAKGYISQQMSFQSLQMAGQELSEEQVASYNALGEQIIAIPEIAEFFKTQMNFAVIFRDVTDIIAKAIDLDMGFFEEDCKA